MNRSLAPLSCVLGLLAATSGCSVERTTSVLGPTKTTSAATAAGTSTTPSLLGTWVVASSDKAAVSKAAGTASVLTDFST